MKGLLRFLAGAFLLVAVMAAVNDVTHSTADKVVTISTYEHWENLAKVTLGAARGSVERMTHPVVWNWGIAPLLRLPAWGLFGLLGLLCAYAGRRRRQVNIFAN
jgi:hypothetical protein